MYNFLFSSLSEQAKHMALSDEADYSIMTSDGLQVCNGPCFLKVVIRNTAGDDWSTVLKRML
jgi:hypothetical protein